MTPSEAKVFIEGKRIGVEPGYPIRLSAKDINDICDLGIALSAKDINDICDLGIALADELALAQSTIKAISVVTVVGDEACRECQEHTQWHGDQEVLAFLSDLEADHPDAWYSRERILLMIKRMREKLTAGADEGRMET